MVRQVTRHARFAIARQIIRRRVQLVRHQHDLARNQAGIGLLPKAQDQVERIADRVDRTHAQIEIAFDIGMLLAKFADDGRQEQLSQAGWQRDTQPPLGLHRHVQQLVVRNACFFNNMAAAFEIDRAGFGQVDLARAAVQQPHPHAAFQFADTARQRGRWNIQGFGGVAEVLALGDFDKKRDVVKLDIHGVLDSVNSISGRFV